MKKRYTKRRKTRHNRLIRKTMRGGVSSASAPRNKIIEYYGDDSVFLFNEDMDIFGDPFETGNTGKPIYGKYTLKEWNEKPRNDRESELKKANPKQDNNPIVKPSRVQGRIESVVEYINKKNKFVFDEFMKKIPSSKKHLKNQNTTVTIPNPISYPFILTIPAFKYEENGGEMTLPEETVPDSSSPEYEKVPILPDDFLRFTRRSDVLNILFPFFMKVYVSLLKELNEDVGKTNAEENAKNLESMNYVLYLLREIQGFASPIWFSPIYGAFYKMGLHKYFKIAKQGYDVYIQKLTDALAKTKETPVETTMYSFPSYANCNDANCEPEITKPIHTIFMSNREFDEQIPIDSYLNMIFYGKDNKTEAMSALKNQIKKEPVDEYRN